MSDEGCSSDTNAVVSFFSTLKHELGLAEEAEILNFPNNCSGTSPVPQAKLSLRFPQAYYNRQAGCKLLILLTKCLFSAGG